VKKDAKTITIERTFDATVEDLWEMWTTKEGVEAWWGPDGFDVTVFELDVRPGGGLHYSMNARGPDQIAFMKKEKMPTSHAVRGRFTTVVPNERIAFIHIARTRRRSSSRPSRSFTRRRTAFVSCSRSRPCPTRCGRSA
jgi:uncharacterized protein YndB with AHSA1/START domain